MNCRECGFFSQIAFPKCPICGAFSNGNYLFIRLQKMFSWICDRRICLISKRQNIDRNLYRHDPLPSYCRGMHRIWWVYRLFDVIPIGIVQCSTSIFIFDPMPEQKPPVQNSTSNSGTMN
jgi:hypothetical protein